MHDRAEHILAKNPSMPKSEAFALATQQMHSLGKSPKGYGTAEGRATAKAKFDTPKDDRKTANPGHLESPKMAAKKDEDEKPSLLRRAAPVGAAAALAGLGTYGALRKFRPSAIPELRALQEKAKDKAFEVATSAPQGRGLRSMLFGAKDIPSNLRDTVGGVARPGATVLQHTGNQATTHGAVTINAGVLPGALDDKHTFSQVMQHGTGGGAGLEGAIPKTDLLKQRLREVPHEHLSKAYPTGYVIKPRTGSMSKAENLLTEATPADDPRLREALRNPGEFIIQEKIPIQKEFRVHLVNNVPFTASHRELPHEGLRSLWNKHMGGGGGAFVPVMGEERQRLMDFARNSTKHIGQTEGGNLMGQSEHLHHALDIARLPDGSFKVIESNPTPGTLMNPIVSRKLQHMVTGRVPKDVAALGGLGAAAGTGLAARAIMNRDQEKTGEAVDEKKFKLQGRTTFQGLGIAIENRKGSVRSGVDRDGKPWRTEMKHPYGYIKGTKGADGEEIDVYVGPDKKAPEAHVVHQHKSNGKGYDEDKVMLGFPSLEAARKAYLAHYNSPKFLGPISSMPVEVLKKIMHKGEKLVPPKSEHLDKVASAFFDELMKLAMDYWDTTTGGKSPAVLQAMAAKQGLPSFSALRQQWDQNAAHALRRTDEVGQQVPAIRENLGKSDRQLEAEWAQRHMAQKEQAAAAANAAMPATGAHSPAAMRAQAAPPPPAALPHTPTSVALPPMHPRAAGVGPGGGGGVPALPQAARAAQGALAANVKGPIIPRLPRPMAAAGALPAFHPKMKLGAIKEAITRSVREYQRGTPEQQAEIARASGQLGKKPAVGTIGKVLAHA